MTERDEKGRFIKGNGGGPGRPKKSREQRYMYITMTACTFADWKAIVVRAVEDAKKGDANARKFLSDYLVGPPVQKHAVANVDWSNLVIDWGDGDDSAYSETED